MDSFRIPIMSFLVSLKVPYWDPFSLSHSSMTSRTISASVISSSMLMTLPSYFQNIQTIEDVLNEDMENFGRYFEQNELLLNLKKGKTEVMLFGTSRRIRLHVSELKILHNNTKINFVSEYVYLGNLMDNHLSLASNFDQSVRKATSCLRMLLNVRKSLTIEAAILIYEMMILSIVTYSSTIKTCFTET